MRTELSVDEKKEMTAEHEGREDINGSEDRIWRKLR